MIRAFIPIATKKGDEIIGTIEAGHDISRKSVIEEKEVAMLKALADQAALAIRNYNNQKDYIESELLKLVPYMAHILQRPNADLIVFLGELKRMVEMGRPDMNRFRKYIIMASRSALTAYLMSNTLAEEVKLRTGTQQVEMVNLVEIITRPIEILQPDGVSFDSEDVRIDLSVDLEQTRIPMTKLECKWLEIIMLNLLVNARKFSPPAVSYESNVSTIKQRTLSSVLSIRARAYRLKSLCFAPAVEHMWRVGRKEAGWAFIPLRSWWIPCVGSAWQ